MGLKKTEIERLKLYNSWVTAFYIITSDYENMLKKSTGLSLTLASVILACAGSPNGVRSGHIAKQLHLQANTTTAAVRQLEKRGMLVCRSDDTDRRAVLIMLTEKGLEVLESLKEVHDRYASIFATQSEEEDSELTTAVVSNMSQLVTIKGLGDPYDLNYSYLITESNILHELSYFARRRNLTLSSMRLLCDIACSPEPEPVNVIGSRLCLRQGTLSLCLASLEKSGFVRRTKHDADRRIVEVYLEPPGEKLVKDIFSHFEQHLSSTGFEIIYPAPPVLGGLLFKTI